MANNKIRIAMISVHGDPLAKMGSRESGGQNAYVHSLSKDLGKRKIYVDVFSRLDNKNKKRVIAYARNVRVIRIPAGERKYIPKNQLLPLMPEFISGILNFKFQDKVNYDLIHSNYFISGWVGLRLKNILTIPLTITFHSLGFIRFKTLNQFKEQSIDSTEVHTRLNIEKEILTHADRIIATSPQEKENMVKYYNVQARKVEIIPCGVDLIRFHPIDQSLARRRLSVSRRKKIILYVGRIEWRKGIGTLIVAFSRLVKGIRSLANIELWIVGGKFKDGERSDREEYNRLKKIAEGYGVEKKIKFLGSVYQKRLYIYYSASNLCVVPSYYEPFGLVPLEAMACETPVVASRIGGLQYTIHHRKNGLLVPPRKPTYLAQAMEKIILDKKFAKKMVREGKGLVKHNFDWNIIAKQMSKFYNKVIKTHEKKTKNRYPFSF